MGLAHLDRICNDLHLLLQAADLHGDIDAVLLIDREVDIGGDEPEPCMGLTERPRKAPESDTVRANR